MSKEEWKLSERKGACVQQALEILDGNGIQSQSLEQDKHQCVYQDKFKQPLQTLKESVKASEGLRIGVQIREVNKADLARLQQTG